MVTQKYWNRNWGTLEIFIYCSFFNPFKRRLFGEIVPIFNFLPQIGVSLDIQEKSYRNLSLGIHICFFNFEFKVWFNIWFKNNSVNNKKVIENGNID